MRKQIVKFASILFFILTFSILIFAEEMTIRILCWEGYAKPYVNGFKTIVKDKYNIDVNVEIKNLSNPADFFETLRIKETDLISPSHNLIKSTRWPFISSGTLIPIDLDNIPNYKKLLSFLKKNDFLTSNGKVYAVPYSMGTYALAYNASKVKAPKSWSVLWDNSSKGKISISKDYSDCNIYITALNLGANYNEIYNFDELTKKIPISSLQEKLTKLAQNAYSFWPGVANHEDFDKLLYATTWGYAVQQVNKKGGNWKIAKPKEGSTAWIDNWSISSTVANDPKKKKILEEWINYMLSPEVQTGVIRNWGSSPVIKKDSIKNLLTKEEMENFNVGNEKYFKSLSLWKNQDKRTQNGYKILWDNALKK